MDNNYLNLAGQDSFSKGALRRTFKRLRSKDPVSWTRGDETARRIFTMRTVSKPGCIRSNVSSGVKSIPVEAGA